MNTTLLFAELLIIGLQATIWVYLLITNIWGQRWLSAFQTIGLSDWQTVLIVVGLSIVYVLGIVFDRIADLIFSGWDKRIRNQIMPDAPLNIAAMRFELGKDNEYLNRQFEYTRSRMRIARASTLNFSVITLLASTFILIHLQNNTEQLSYLIAVVIIGVGLTGLTIYTWYKLTHTYLNLVKTNYELYTSKDDPAERSLAPQTSDCHDEE